MEVIKCLLLAVLLFGSILLLCIWLDNYCRRNKIHLKNNKIMTDEELIKEAERRYPAGTVFISPGDDKEVSEEIVPEYVKVVNPPTSWCKEGEILQFRKNKDGSYSFKYNPALNKEGTSSWDSYGTSYTLKGLLDKFFKPSTKEAFDAQFKSIDNLEYIEYLESYVGQFSKGTIYKVKSIDSAIYCVEKDDRGSVNNGWAKEKFKLSTKEAYDLQEANKNAPSSPKNPLGVRSNLKSKDVKPGDKVRVVCLKASDSDWEGVGKVPIYLKLGEELEVVEVGTGIKTLNNSFYPAHMFELVKKESEIKSYFSTDPLIKQLEDHVRDWIPHVTKYKSAYIDDAGVRGIRIFTGIGKIVKSDTVDRVWDASSIGWIYNNGIFGEKCIEDLPLNPAFDTKAYDSKPINQVFKLKKVNKQKPKIKF